MRIPISEVKPDTGTATVIGWIHEIRDLGGLSFYILRDREYTDLIFLCFGIFVLLLGLILWIAN